MKFCIYRPSIKTKSLTKRKPVSFDSQVVSDCSTAKEQTSNDGSHISHSSKVGDIEQNSEKQQKRGTEMPSDGVPEASARVVFV